MKETFGAEPTDQQNEVLKSLSSHKKVSVRAGHGVGKSTLASWAVYWFLLTRPGSRIICTAPTFHQLNDILWAEAAMWRQKSELITKLFDWKQRRIECTLAPATWWAAARTAEKGESLIGRHAGDFLLIVDEASGVEDHIFEASEGMLTGENSYVLLIGNPTRNVGYFYDSHNKNAALWKTHILSCYDSPIVSKTYIDEMRYKYGEDSNTFRIKVLGEFPYDEQDTLIPHNWIQDAQERKLQVTKEPLFMGVDVGAGGNLSAIAFRRGGNIERIYTNNSKDTMELVGWVALKAQEHKANAIFIDPIGIGKGAFDRLNELNFRVYPVDVRMKPRKVGFRGLRDELWWKVREQFENGLISIPSDDDLTKELSGIKYKPESSGKIKVESKMEMRKRKTAGFSPDRADALCLTYYLDDRVFETPEESKDLLVVDDKYIPRDNSKGWMRA